jgi:hypothetical protein
MMKWVAAPIRGRGGTGGVHIGGRRPWVILVFNAVMLVWLVAGLGPPPDCASEATEALREECESGIDFGWAGAAVITVFFWIVGDVILGVLWIVAFLRGQPD